MKTETTKKAGRARITTKEVTTPELYSYLKRHRLCKKYLRNLREQYPETVEGILNCKYNVRRSITASFTWYDTPQGHDFWRKHDKKQQAEG